MRIAIQILNRPTPVYKEVYEHRGRPIPPTVKEQRPPATPLPVATEELPAEVPWKNKKKK